MIVKIHNRGTGGGAGPVDYLLGKDRKRDKAVCLRGDPEVTKAIIDASQYAKKYTSGVLSFAEPDLPADKKQLLMDSFVTMLLPGLDRDQYDCLWVEHRDKDRLELNFLIPNIELLTGKRLQPFYHGADGARVDCWKRLVNDEWDLHSPDDPANRQSLSLPADLPKGTKEIHEAITSGLLNLIKTGAIQNRAGIVNALTDGGFNVSRQTDRSISIKNPTPGGRNIRLKGALYEIDFQSGPDLQGEIEDRSRKYRESRKDRIPELRKELDSRIAFKSKEIAKRHPRPEPEPFRSNPRPEPFRSNPRPEPEPFKDFREQRQDDKPLGTQELESRVYSDNNHAATERERGDGAGLAIGEAEQGPMADESARSSNRDLQDTTGPSPMHRNRPKPKPDVRERKSLHVPEKESLNERIRNATRIFCERAISHARKAVSGFEPISEWISKELRNSESSGKRAERNHQHLSRISSEIGRHAQRAREGLERDAIEAGRNDIVIETLNDLVLKYEKRLKKEQDNERQGPSMRF